MQDTQQTHTSVCIVLRIHVHGQRVTYTTGAGNACLRPQTMPYRNVHWVPAKYNLDES